MQGVHAADILHAIARAYGVALHSTPQADPAVWQALQPLLLQREQAANGAVVGSGALDPNRGGHV